MKGIRGTSIANLNPDERLKNPNKTLSILEGITNWSYFTWPTDGDLSGYICAHSLPNFGTWNTFSPFDIKKSLKDQELIKPNPSTSVKTTPSSEWTIPLPSKGRIKFNFNLRQIINEMN